MRAKTCFAVSPAPIGKFCGQAVLPQIGLDTVCGRPATVLTSSPQRRARVSMGLFGLGFPELAVIAGVGILIFGPSKIAEMGKDLGGFAGGVKKATSEFKEAMEESLEEADREIERKKLEKEAAANQTVDTSASAVEQAEKGEK